ncbi:MAG: glycerol-3-phosphate dehydrogenase/oxidase [Chlamydiae bacterium]|nr:glycerol-3-phosphate dehydrogenase/oxidase [Chlamydiota bacterium]MBI3267343.1 glycerol-3-phosphate dehydrogenase/oxidase [Chlamydiota bacterium]
MKRDVSVFNNNIYDLLVIGGGIYGAFIAWDAVLRGFSVALVERGDFSGATSANSQKIIHGGFRYLQHGDFKRMRESIRERTNLMRIAPHLIHPLPVLVPTYGHGIKSKEILRMALMMYDAVGFDRNQLSDPEKRIPRGRIFSKEKVLQLLPNFPQEALTGAGVFYDATVYNSERLVISVLKSAEQKGVNLANYVETIGFIQKGDRVTGIECRDALTGSTFPVQARTVVNASGPWLYRVLSLLEPYRSRVKFPLVKSFNVITRLLFEKYAVGLYGKNSYQDQDALLNKGTRLFFVTPWRNHSVVGTALSYFEGNPDELKVTSEEIEKFLEDFNLACPQAKLKPEEVTFVHRGFLPSAGLGGKAGDVQISKKYRIINHRTDGLNGLISVIGVKYTTARDVAEKVVDHVFECRGDKAPQSLSRFTPVYGGQIEKFDDFLKDQIKNRLAGWDENLVRSLVYNYGSSYSEIKASSPQDLMRHEVIHAIQEEMAQKLVDVVLRRTEWGTAGCPEDSILDLCAQTMALELGWDSARIRSEIEEVKKFYAWSI